MTQQKGYKYAVGGIGIGRAGTGRVRTYESHGPCKVVAVADSDPENLELAIERFGVPGYATADEMYAHHAIDIAVASLPVRANHEVVMSSVRAGVRFMVTEKPLTARLSDADEMVNACSAKGIGLAAGLVSRNRWNHIKAREMIEAGEIGEVVRINIYDHNAQGGCHGPNLARHFASDAPVDRVIGWTSGDASSDHEDVDDKGKPGFGGLAGYIRFANGIEVYSSYRRTGWRAFEVIGTKGIIFKTSVASRELHVLKGSKETVASHEDLAEVPDMNRSLVDDEGGFDEDGWAIPTDGMVHSTKAVVEALDTGDPVKLTTGDDLRQALEICIALRESARRGNTPITLPIEDRSLIMYPQQRRWNYKKEIMGREAYMEAMSHRKRD